MRRFAPIRLKLALVLLVPWLAAPNCDNTGGTKWQGDYSACDTVSPADTTIQTQGDPTINKEYGQVTPEYSGHPGCDYAYIIDYLMPPPGTNVNPGWDWAWIHVASRIPNMDAATCNSSWTSLRVYGYWTYQGNPQKKLLDETYRKGSWNGSGCDFGLPDNVWMSSAYTRVRAVSQHGITILKDRPHYSYFVTNRHD
jgi:hypothetical protein